MYNTVRLATYLPRQRMVNLTLLAPDIVAAILDDQLPRGISLFDLAVDVPVGWEVQRMRVGAISASG